MSRFLALGSLALAMVASAPALAGDPPPPRGPLAIFVQARPDEAERNAADLAALKGKSESAAKTANDAYKDLKKQYGKDKAKWPADRRSAYFDAVDAAGTAWSEAYYYARPAAEKADSVKDFSDKLAKRKDKYVTLAASREQADLVIEVMGRRGMAKFVSGSKYLCFDLLPGKVPADALLDLPRERFDPWFDDRVWALRWPKPGEPGFRFEVNDSERWSDVADYGVRTVEEVAKTYYDALKPAR